MLRNMPVNVWRIRKFQISPDFVQTTEFWLNPGLVPKVLHNFEFCAEISGISPSERHFFCACNRLKFWQSSGFVYIGWSLKIWACIFQLAYLSLQNWAYSNHHHHLKNQSCYQLTNSVFNQHQINLKTVVESLLVSWLMRLWANTLDHLVRSLQLRAWDGIHYGLLTALTNLILRCQSWNLVMFLQPLTSCSGHKGGVLPGTSCFTYNPVHETPID